MWKAKITQVSSVDSNGGLELAFDIYVDGKVLYPNQFINTQPDQAESVIKQKMALLKESVLRAKTIKIGDEITL